MNKLNIGDCSIRKFNKGGRFLSIDPLWEKYYSLTPYHYCSNNPVNATDPSGLASFTDKNGVVLYVDNDKDNSIYKSDLTFTKNKRYFAKNFDKNECENVGKTKFWNEFISPETGSVYHHKIEFGNSWESVLTNKNKEANNYLYGDASIAFESLPGVSLDIKSQSSNREKIKLIGEYYFTARSAGNYLAGWIGSESMMSHGIYSGIVGALDNLQDGKLGFQEDIYSQRMIDLGWNNKSNFNFK